MRKIVRQVRRGEFYECNYAFPISKSETNPYALIVQNDIGNRFSNTTIALPVFINEGKIKIGFDYICTLDKKHLFDMRGKFTEKQMDYVDNQLLVRFRKDKSKEKSKMFYDRVISEAREHEGMDKFIKEIENLKNSL